MSGHHHLVDEALDLVACANVDAYYKEIDSFERRYRIKCERKQLELQNGMYTYNKHGSELNFKRLCQIQRELKEMKNEKVKPEETSVANFEETKDEENPTSGGHLDLVEKAFFASKALDYMKEYERKEIELKNAMNTLREDKNFSNRKRVLELVRELNELVDEQVDEIMRRQKQRGEEEMFSIHSDDSVEEMDFLKRYRIKYERMEIELKNAFLTFHKEKDPVRVVEVITELSELVDEKIDEMRRLKQKREEAAVAKFQEWIFGLEERLHERVVGQDEAVSAVAKAVLRFRSGLGRRPIGTFLFLGSTGVGKNEVANALAEQLLDDENKLVRINMSEYTEPHSAARLIEEALSIKPHSSSVSVVVFDKVEKAHISVVDALLQVLDGGRRLKDVDSVIIMTSNLLGLQEAREHFKPELLIKFDEIVVFEPPSRDQLLEVARLQMKDVVARLEHSGVMLGVTEGALGFVWEKGYDPVYGARSMSRWVEKNVVSELSAMLIRRDIEKNSNVSIDVAADQGGGLTYQVEKNGGPKQNSAIKQLLQK